MRCICPVLLITLVLTSCSSIRTKEEKAILSTERVTHTGPKIPISVVQFRNRSATSDTLECRGWFNYPDLGDAFAERLISALGRYEKFDVLERETIRDVFENEVNLLNSGKVAPIERGRFEKARYTLVGVVTSFELCAEDIAAGVVMQMFTGFGGGVGKSTRAKVEVLVRAIDTRTGKVIATTRGEGTQRRTGFTGFGSTVSGGAGISAGRKDTLGQAIDLAIGKALLELEPKLQI